MKDTKVAETKQEAPDTSAREVNKDTGKSGEQNVQKDPQGQDATKWRNPSEEPIHPDSQE